MPELAPVITKTGESAMGPTLPRRRGASARDDLERADVRELVHAHRGELTAVAGALDAAEREPRVGGDEGIHRDQAGFDPARHGLRALRVLAPDGGAEPVARVVGQLDGLVLARERRDRD